MDSVIGLSDRSQPPRTFKSDAYTCGFGRCVILGCAYSAPLDLPSFLLWDFSIFAPTCNFTHLKDGFWCCVAVGCFRLTSSQSASMLKAFTRFCQRVTSTGGLFFLNKTSSCIFMQRFILKVVNKHSNRI